MKQDHSCYNLSPICTLELFCDLKTENVVVYLTILNVPKTAPTFILKVKLKN